jgi:hypothetical protein
VHKIRRTYALDEQNQVQQTQGHDSLTSMRHYQELAFTENELQGIKKQLTAWGILK